MTDLHIQDQLIPRRILPRVRALSSSSSRAAELTSISIRKDGDRHRGSPGGRGVAAGGPGLDSGVGRRRRGGEGDAGTGVEEDGFSSTQPNVSPKF